MFKNTVLVPVCTISRIKNDNYFSICEFSLTIFFECRIFVVEMFTKKWTEPFCQTNSSIIKWYTNGQLPSV